MIKYLLILGIGHLLGDFYFQTEKIAALKNKHYYGVLLHSIEYYAAFLFAILPVFSIDMVACAIIAGTIHFIIDTLKYIYIKIAKIYRAYVVFMVDQAAHIVALFSVAFFICYYNFTIGRISVVRELITTFGYDYETVARWTLAVLFINRPANIFIQKFLSEYKPKTDEAIITPESKIESKAGRKIGSLERLIILLFLKKDQFSALGFVLTAKSIARYDRITKDEKFAEYYLLGTLLSTICVIVCRLFIF